MKNISHRVLVTTKLFTGQNIPIISWTSRDATGTLVFWICKLKIWNIPSFLFCEYGQSTLFSLCLWIRSHNQGILTEGEGLVQFTSPFSSFCNKVNNGFSIKSSWSKLVSTRRSTVLSLPLQLVFPAIMFLSSLVGSFVGPN